jgi:TolA-binding protein
VPAVCRSRAAAERLYTQANALALQGLAATTNNTRQVEILEQLNRRRVYDLGKNHDAIEQYNSLKHHIHNTLWSPSNAYFDYLRWIGLALTREQPDQAAAHYQSILDDAANPPGPRAQLTLELAEHLIHHHKQPQNALTLIKSTLAEHPTGPHTPRAHYWLMVDALAKKQTVTAKEHAKALLSNIRNVSDQETLFFEISALYVIHDENISAARNHYSEAWTATSENKALAQLRRNTYALS